MTLALNITTKTKAKGVRYGCGCVRISLLKNLFGGTKAIHLILLPDKCPEHNSEIVSIIDRKRGT